MSTESREYRQLAQCKRLVKVFLAVPRRTKLRMHLHVCELSESLYGNMEQRLTKCQRYSISPLRKPGLRQIKSTQRAEHTTLHKSDKEDALTEFKTAHTVMGGTS